MTDDVREMVSVIVPVYNSAGFLVNCVESILSQYYGDLELILVNDGSTDSSLEICRAFENKDERVKVINQPNGGVTAARSAGVQVAKGEWICFVDSDDFIPRESIQCLVESSCDCDIVVGQILVSQEVVWNYPSFDEKMDYKTAIEYLFRGRIHTGPVAKLYRREIFDDKIRGIPSEITHGEDFLMNCILFQNARMVRVIKNGVYNYVFRESSVSNRSNPYTNLKYCQMQEMCLRKLIKSENESLMMPLLRKLIIMHRRRIIKNVVKRIIGR